MESKTPHPLVVVSTPAALRALAKECPGNSTTGASLALNSARPLNEYLTACSPRDSSDAFTVVLNLAGAAFQDLRNSGREIARILRELADKLDGGHSTFPSIMDANGNVCGEAGYFDMYPLK